MFQKKSCHPGCDGRIGNEAILLKHVDNICGKGIDETTYKINYRGIVSCDLLQEKKVNILKVANFLESDCRFTSYLHIDQSGKMLKKCVQITSHDAVKHWLVLGITSLTILELNLLAAGFCYQLHELVSSK